MQKLTKNPDFLVILFKIPSLFLKILKFQVFTVFFCLTCQIPGFSRLYGNPADSFQQNLLCNKHYNQTFKSFQFNLKNTVFTFSTYRVFRKGPVFACNQKQVRIYHRTLPLWPPSANQLTSFYPTVLAVWKNCDYLTEQKIVLRLKY